MRRMPTALLTIGAALLTLCAPAFGAQKTAPLALGYYQCYLTTKYVSPINGEVSYGTIFESSFTLKSNSRYTVSFLYSGAGGTGRIVVKGHNVRFVGGAWDSDANSWHLKGTVYPHGITMPHSQLSPAKRYKLVLRGSPNDADTAPPTSEFAGSVPRSFWYCNKR
jgi:hypothetical protein